MNDMIQRVFQGIVEGQQNAVAEGVDAALESGVPAMTILEKGECYVPEMMVSARAMKAGLAKLKPSLTQTDTQTAGTVALAKALIPPSA